LGRRERMDRKLVGSVVIAAGVALLVVSALAEPIGLGDDDGIGWKQTVGIIVGAAVAVVGLALMYVRRGGAKTVQPHA
jgi:uncharacterized membrane protein